MMKKGKKVKENLPRLLAVLLVTGMLTVGLTACDKDSKPSDSDSSSGGAALSVSVMIEGQNAMVAEGTAKLDKDKNTAEAAIRQVCDEKGVTYTLQDGMFDNFGGEASTNTDGWLLYVNGALSDVGAGDTKLQDNDQVAFRYVNYDEAFGG